eukprot:TRINITY_DN14696_c0_g1_i1.p1 TRINITY_DN14696_c0_g1~~TRINITY_DN14696_c0_g1_i1.p1  ORF type:complete len:672 (+),score=146.82 TRINITY_DN14696_c0_g1_i1:50-2065(+)
MDLRQFVGPGGEKGSESRSANPILNMVDMFTSDKAQHMEKWDQGPLPEMMLRNSNNNINDRNQQQVRNFMNPRELDRFEELDIPGVGPHEYDPLHMPGPGPMMHQPGPMGMHRPQGPRGYGPDMMGPMNMPHGEKQMGGRPYMPNPQFMDAQMANMMGKMRIADEHKGWIDEYDKVAHEERMPKEFEEFERIYQERPMHRPPPMNNMMHRPPQGWLEEFENREFDDIYEKGAQGKQWVDEFHDERRAPMWNQDIRGMTARAVSQLNDPKMRNSNFVQLLNKISTGEVQIDENKQTIVETPQSERWANEFDTFDGGPQQQQRGGWVNEFENFDEPKQWVEDFEKFDMNDPQWVNDFTGSATEEWIKQYQEIMKNNGFLEQPDYQFQQENPFMNHPAPFEKGMELFNRGDIPEAILCFESAVQRDEKHVRAWQFLGRAQAENDKDDLAIAALNGAIKADPGNLDALLNLSVSYTNDFHKDKALDTLVQWMQYNPQYREVFLKFPPFDLNEDFEANHHLVTDMFIEAARLRPQDPDPDVQTGLGLLFNLSADYDRAIDCFKAALIKHPDDYLLWNKLGATQANSAKSGEAVEAYFRALEIKPTYTRARANLGIAYLSLKEYVEAAKSFLGAVSINPAKHLWDNLRTVFSMMNRPDLVELCNLQDVDMFRGEFAF